MDIKEDLVFVDTEDRKTVWDETNERLDKVIELLEAILEDRSFR